LYAMLAVLLLKLVQLLGKVKEVISGNECS
jgi:hypothetical protein